MRAQYGCNDARLKELITVPISDETVPFGLLFEEAAARPKYAVSPTYDELTDLSYVLDASGCPVPVVEANKGIQLNNGSGRFRQSEHNSEEPCLLAFQGTQTITEEEIETTDTDPGDDTSFLQITETVTKMHPEATDKD